jgi:hypothetical protein
MFKCWSCGTDYPDVPFASNAQYEEKELVILDDGALREKHRLLKMINAYRLQLIDSVDNAEEHQQGIFDGLKIALDMIGNK